MEVWHCQIQSHIAFLSAHIAIPQAQLAQRLYYELAGRRSYQYHTESI